MKPIFNNPYNIRKYPSPRTGGHVTAYVKEILFDDYPAKFVDDHLKIAYESNCNLFVGATGGMR
jgi:hypothetical protein